MGIPKFRGRGANGFIRTAGLGQHMKHSLPFGPRGMRPRFPIPPPGMPLHVQNLPPPGPLAMRPPAMRPPGFLPPPMPGVGRLTFPPPLPPPPLPPPPSFYMPPMPPLPPLPPVARGNLFQAGFGPLRARGGRSGPGPLRGRRGSVRGNKTNTKANTNNEEAELDKPWISEAIKNEILKKQELLQKAKKSNSEDDWNEYRVHLEKVTVIVNEAKLEFIGSHPEEGGAFYCETCDRDLKNAQKLAQHLAEHSVCGHDGCTFEAHHKVIEMHIRMQHWTGLYKKICVADNPCEIAKWIEERKKRYPTKANIERREAEMKEQVDRGERLAHEPQSFMAYARGRNAWRGRRGNATRENLEKLDMEKKEQVDEDNIGQEPQSLNSFKRGRVMHRGGRGRYMRMRGRYRRFRSRPDGVADGNGDDEDDNGRELEYWNAQVAEEEKLLSRGRLLPFPGTGAFPDSCEDPVQNAQDEGFSDAEWESTPAGSHTKHPVASRVLMSLIGSYASDLSDNEGYGKGGTGGALHTSLAAGNCHNDTVPESQGPEGSKSGALPAVSSAAGNCSDAIPENQVPGDDSDGAPEETPIVFKQPEEPPPVVAPGADVKADNASHPRKRHGHKYKRRKDAEGSSGTPFEDRPRRPVATRPWYPRQRKPTLLDKLLRDEIRHERNIILQCVNYIVKNGFFDSCSVSVATDSATNNPCDARVKILSQCISHIVQCGMLDTDVTLNTDSNLLACT